MILGMKLLWDDTYYYGDIEGVKKFLQSLAFLKTNTSPSPLYINDSKSPMLKY